VRARTQTVSVVAHLVDEVITTTEAAKLTGRTVGAVRQAARRGVLPSVGKNPDGFHQLRRSDVLVWDRTHRRQTMPTRRPWERTAQAVAELEVATTDELAAYVGLHVGNVRKHLLILRAQGRAERRDDGQWVLTADAHAGAA
jgi:DNA-directed RNA polymerase specialized sigma24 family protein